MIHQLVHGLVGLLYPRCCPVCGEIVVPNGELICPACISRLSFVKEPVCKKCGKELTSEVAEYCFDCSKHRHSFEYGRALLNYNEAAQKSMVKIKYKNKREYLDYYVAEVCARYEKHLYRMNADALIPIPVHPTRMRQRGFNQAELLACGIGKKLNIPVCTDALMRNKKTLPQKTLSPSERLKNLEEAFIAGEMVRDLRSIILVDDIYTTGSTIEACTRALLKAGVQSVYFVALCIGSGNT